MKITISGMIGSGKSTVAKALAKKLGYKHYSVGDFLRELAAQRNCTPLEIGELAKHDDGEIDQQLDAMAVELAQNEDNFVLDARVGFHFIPESFKIYLDVSVEEAARRIFTAKRSEESENTSLESTQEAIRRRRGQEKHRYKKYYDIELPPKTGMDLVIDTTTLGPEEIVECILDQISQANL